MAAGNQKPPPFGYFLPRARPKPIISHPDRSSKILDDHETIGVPVVWRLLRSGDARGDHCRGARERLLRIGTAHKKPVWRAPIVLLTADGVGIKEISQIRITDVTLLLSVETLA